MSNDNNALDLLMKTAREGGISQPSPPSTSARGRKRSRQEPSPGRDGESRFVRCPACGDHIFWDRVNTHLDNCLDESSSLAASNTGVDASTSATGGGERSYNKISQGPNAKSELSSVVNSPHIYKSNATQHQKHSTSPFSTTTSDAINPLENKTETKLNFDHTTHQSPEVSLRVSSPTHIISPRAQKQPSKLDDSHNAFSHMMKRSAAIFYNHEYATKQRFHLHNIDGLVTWTSEDENDIACDPMNKGEGRKNHTRSNAGGKDDAVEKTPKSVPSTEKKHINASSFTPDDVQWSATTTIKKPHVVHLGSKDKNQIHQQPDSPTKKKEQIYKSLELTISSSIPIPQEGQNRCRLVQTHSRLSVPHLKSCLQKSIRRRAPMPAVRVAMELADKSWGDLIRRLPIIVLEDSTLHPDFPLLVWLMVADSKNYVPPMPLMVRVMQIVFEMASCPKQDLATETEEGQLNIELHQLPETISLTSPSRMLFPTQQSSLVAHETYVKSMLLRAQYGGMSCDVKMLHSFSVKWLKRFYHEFVPKNIISSLPILKDGKSEGGTTGEDAATSSENNLTWQQYPSRVHATCREQSQELVTPNFVCAGGLLKLKKTDVCAAGIDFHCSPVVDNLLSNPRLVASLRDSFRNQKENTEMDKDWLSRQVKHCIWNFSSGINHRRPIYPAIKDSDNYNEGLPSLKGVWDEVLKAPFDEYTKAFVCSRLS